MGRKGKVGRKEKGGKEGLREKKEINVNRKKDIGILTLYTL